MHKRVFFAHEGKGARRRQLPDYTIRRQGKETINVRGGKLKATVLTLENNKIFAYGKDPIDGKARVFRLSENGWTRVPRKKTGEIISRFLSANPKLQF